MMSSLLTYLLLTAADPATAAAKPGCARPVAAAAAGTAAAPRPDGPDDDCDMAIDEEGLPVEKKDKKKTVLTGPRDCDSDGDAACRAAAAACAAQAKTIVDTYGGHGAHGGKKMAINEQGVQTGPKKGKGSKTTATWSSSPPSAHCPTPAGMAINEKGTATSPKKETKGNK